MKTKLFVDLDDTIINTSQLKEELISLVADRGVDRSTVMQKYEESKDENGIPIIDVFAASFNEFGIAAELLQAGINEIYSDMDEEKLFSERLVWLEDQFPRSEYEYILLTKGEEEIQKKKIARFNLRGYFDEVRIVTGDKVSAIREMIEEGEEFTIVDDKRSELSEVSLGFQGAKLYIVPREGEPRLYEEENNPHRREG